MANRAKLKNRMNHDRQMAYLRKGVVMLPTRREEAGILKMVNRENRAD